MTQPAPVPPRHDRLITSVIILASMAVALAVRILWPHDTVFVDGAVWFREMDSWYRMRLVDSFVHNFPSVTAFDPYSYFPHGIRATFHPLTTWLIGVPALILGGGNPSPELIDTCGAYFPPILGALTVVPVYFIGRHLYGRVAGATAAILIAILPGEFLSRSLLGFTDHHVTEAFFSTLVLLFLMLALREARNVGVVLNRPSDILNPSYRRTITFAVLAGLSLGFYLLAWRGGVFVLAVLVLYSIVRSLLDYQSKRGTDDVVMVFPIAGLIALLMASPTIAVHFMPFLYVAAMLAVPVFPVGLKLLTHLAHRVGWSRWLFIGAMVLCLALALTVLILISPELGDYIIGALDFMVPTGAHLTIMEMHPLFFPGGIFTTTVAWNNFTTTLAIALLAMVMLFKAGRRPRGTDVTLFIVWSITMLAAVLLQRRFGYYFAISVAVLCGFVVGWLFSHPYVRKQMATLRQPAAVPVKARSKSATRALQAHRAEQRTSLVKLGMGVIALVAALVLPNIDMAHNFAAEPGLMTKGWYETLSWLRDNTPEPLDPDAYYRLHEIPGEGDYDYSESAYGIMAWWDYGHWITRLSHRIPVANPFQQGAQTAGRFFTAQSEAEGAAIMEERGCEYVVVDSTTSVRTFHGVAGWAGKERSDYFDLYMQRASSGEWQPVVLYHPEYFNSMLVRLYNFRGEAYEPEEYTAILHRVGNASGRTANEIVESRRFETYDEAVAFLAKATDADWRLVSSNPLVSAVPLDAVENFTIEYESSAETFLQAQLLPEVRVFRFTGDAA
ncbi:MAG: oligosaccharyl transferase, archaeosortase A system-associated [Dehalococcoidia bacterium]|nr:oligosaccharyl transferase, archaeosortase A system-associated [Dehalococcoidia bacterium]